MTLAKNGASVTLNGEQFVRYDDEAGVPRALIAYKAPDEVRAFDAMLAQERAPTFAWQIIYSSKGPMTVRARVPGGWLVKHSSGDGMAMAFVPDTRGSWNVKVEGTA